MDDARGIPRCTLCGRGIPFGDWRRGIEWCTDCDPLSGLVAAAPAATFDRLPSHPAAPARPLVAPMFPDSLVDELVAALEREGHAAAGPAKPGSAFAGLMDEFGVGQSPSELPWAAWGFALGFGANVVLAKYSQMTSGGSFAEFLPPMLLGGVVAGLACAGIGWGIARLKDRSG